MNNTAVGSASLGPVRFSMDADVDTVIIIEQNGVMEYFGPLSAPGSRQVHLISPIYANGTVLHDGQKINFSCQVMPDLKPGMSVKSFVKNVSEALQAKITQKAKFRVPQLLELIRQEGKHVETLDTEYVEMPYKLTYTYTV